MWVIPGAPLQNGSGWRIWYSRPGPADFEPAAVTVRHAGEPQATTSSWTLLAGVQEVGRRMGVRELRLDAPVPGRAYEVTVPEVRSQGPFSWRTMPADIDEDGVSFLLTSCFWQNNDREGAYAAGVKGLQKLWKPVFKLLVGDQLYADWPWDTKLLRGRHPAMERYAERYAQYWGDDTYRAALQTMPNLVTCDDHEFWNNFPEMQPHIGRTIRENDRKQNKEAAEQLYELYQTSLNPEGRRWYSFNIDRVSFFVTDTRSQRDPYRDEYAPNPPHFMQEQQWLELEEWARDLRGPGVLVLGQPLYLERGGWKDYGLWDFRADYKRLWSVIEASLRGDNDHGQPHDILVLSGDIHTGRYSVGIPFGVPAPIGIPELIASPASMVRPGAKDLYMPPAAIRVGPEQTPRLAAYVYSEKEHATLDNNVAVVRMLPGTAGRIRFELMIYSIRPYDRRSWWDRKVLRRKPPRGRLRRHFRTEIELR